MIEKKGGGLNRFSRFLLLMTVQLLYLLAVISVNTWIWRSLTENDVDLIKRYREVAQHPECDMAIEDIINEVIVSDERDTSSIIIVR